MKKQKNLVKEIKSDLPDVIVNCIDLEEKNKKELTNFKEEIKRILSENYDNKNDIIYVKK